MSDIDGTPVNSLLSLPSSLRIITLNCWGLKYLSTYRHERLTEIGHQLAAASPPPTIVGLQECWTQEDFDTIHSLTQHILPYAKFYFSGIFGSGLAILSAYPIEETSMHPYPLNGRPQAFFRGDWYVGKGVAAARIRLGPHRRDVLEVFCTHLHAPYESAGDDSYLCHRTAQAWAIARLLRHAAERGHLVVGLGDFNMLPASSLAHRLVEAHSPCRDVWRRLHPTSAVGAAQDAVERARGLPPPSVDACLAVHGATCDSALNTWRWSAAMRKDLARYRRGGARGAGAPPRPHVDGAAPDLCAKRLDYVFFADNRAVAPGGCAWEVEAVRVGMTAPHPRLGCSLSDHFSVETTLRRREPDGEGTAAAATAAAAEEEEDAMPATNPLITPLPVEAYDEILALIAAYEQRQRKQRRWTLACFPVSVVVVVACLVAVWFSPRNFVAFLLMLVSTLGLGAGVLAGLIGGLFVTWELRTLQEFRHEIRSARAYAVEKQKWED